MKCPVQIGMLLSNLRWLTFLLSHVGYIGIRRNYNIAVILTESLRSRNSHNINSFTFCSSFSLPRLGRAYEPGTLQSYAQSDPRYAEVGQWKAARLPVEDEAEDETSQAVIICMYDFFWISERSAGKYGCTYNFHVYKECSFPIPKSQNPVFCFAVDNVSAPHAEKNWCKARIYFKNTCTYMD